MDDENVLARLQADEDEIQAEVSTRDNDVLAEESDKAAEKIETIFVPELRLLRPAAEPFLLCRVTVTNCPGVIYSIQFNAENESEYHYLNIEFNSRLPSWTPVQYIAVVDLPLVPTTSWQINAIFPDGRQERIGNAYRDEYKLWRLDMVQSPAPVSGKPIRFMFVGGAPKSGTTWVERILNSHPDVLSTGENNFFSWPHPPLFNCFLADQPVFDYSVAVPQKPPFRSQAAMFYAGRAERMLTQLGEISQVKVVADKTPGYGSSAPVIFETLPDAKYIHCVRHPLDVAVSRFFHEKALLINSPELCLLPKNEELREHVLNFNSEGAKLGEMFSNLWLLDFLTDVALEGSIVFSAAKQYPGKVHLLRYEDLLMDFHRTAGAMFAFCGIDVDDETLSTIARRNHFKVFSGGRAPGEANDLEFFRKGIMGDHLNYMTPEQIEYAKRRILMRCQWYRAYFEEN